MGSIWFDKGSLADHLHEVVGYKAGVAASIEHLCDLLADTSHPDTILNSESGLIRLRSEDYEDLYFALIHKVGLTEQPYHPIKEMFAFHQKLRDMGDDAFVHDILDIYRVESQKAAKLASSAGQDKFSPEGMIKLAFEKYGKKGLDATILAIEYIDNVQNLSPHSSGRFQEWVNVENIENLFQRDGQSPAYGKFLDHRLINYLAVNCNRLGSIHWRKFEELIAECFVKSGYKVEIGPGSNDDGVDIRVWLPDEKAVSPPEYLVQCKRQKDKIDKVTVKGLYADVQHENAKMGLLVTTSEFSPGARSVVSARGYSVSEVNGQMIEKWLRELRTPGAGIVRV